MNTIYGGPKTFHTSLLEFAARSAHDIYYEGETYRIHHSQFCRYPVAELFRAFVEETDVDPFEGEFTDRDILVEAAEGTSAYVDFDTKSYYKPIERVERRDIGNALSDYRMAQEDDDHYQTVQPTAETREEGFAELITLINAEKASMEAQLFFNQRMTDVDEDDTPDPGVDTELVCYAIYQAIEEREGSNSLTRPDPSLKTVAEIFELTDYMGMNPDVRPAYGLFVSQTTSRFYEPDDADGRRMKKQMGGLMMPGGNTQSIEKWMSDEELDEYDPDELREQDRSQ